MKGEDIAFQNPTRPIGAGGYLERMREDASLPTGAKSFDPTHEVINFPVEQVKQS
jgi:hypothetical protein